MLFNPQHGFADRAPAPSVVIASKPDIYDAHGALAEYLERNRYRHMASFTAFDVWKSPAMRPAEIMMTEARLRQGRAPSADGFPSRAAGPACAGVGTEVLE